MPFEDEIAELARRRQAAEAMGSKKRLDEWAAQGVLNARQRLARLLDHGSFVEWGQLAVSEREDDRHRTPGDGVIDGYGRIDGRPVVVHAADFSAMGASSAFVASAKMSHSIANAKKNGLPLVLLNECSGARMPDFMGAQGIHRAAHRFAGLARERGQPWASAVLGQSFGGGTWLSVMSDFLVMRKGAIMAVSSQNVTSVAISEAGDPEELGGWRMQTEVTGRVDLAVDGDEEALDAVKRFLSYLPSHAGAPAPRRDGPHEAGGEQDEILAVLPESRAKVYDVRKVLRLIVDRDSFFPLKERFARVAVTALARIDGRPVAIVATNPMFKGGALDADACDKIVSLIVLADSFNLPILTFADTPGFLVGTVGERQKLPGKIMNYVQAYALASVPKLSVILRKSFGQAHINIGAGIADELACWFTGEISFVDPEVGVNVVYRVRKSEEPERYADLAAKLARGTGPYDLAEPFMAQTVLDPRETRAWLSSMLDLHARAPAGGVGQHRLSTWPTTF
jgi:acetyl-CoA carboxylase carboxyltransferase component